MSPSNVNLAGRALAKGAAYGQLNRVAGRFDESTERFKTAAAGRIESVAGQIRDLGLQLEHPGEANSIARRLERTADYIRYRPSTEVAGDAWTAARKHHLLWWAGGLLAGVFVIRLLQNSRSHDEN